MNKNKYYTPPAFFLFEFLFKFLILNQRSIALGLSEKQNLNPSLEEGHKFPIFLEEGRGDPNFEAKETPTIFK